MCSMNLLCSFCCAISQWEMFKAASRFENVTSDINFIELCLKEEKVPKGFRWKLTVQGLGDENQQRIDVIKKDAELRVMQEVKRGMHEKRRRLEEEADRGIEEMMKQKDRWDGMNCLKKLDEYQEKAREEARQRKEKKLKSLGICILNGKERNKCRSGMVESTSKGW